MDVFSPHFAGKPFNAKNLINNAVSNIICCLVFGNRFEYTDKQFQYILQMFNDIVRLQGNLTVRVSACYSHTHVLLVPVSNMDVNVCLINLHIYLLWCPLGGFSPLCITSEIHSRKDYLLNVDLQYSSIRFTHRRKSQTEPIHPFIF